MCFLRVFRLQRPRFPSPPFVAPERQRYNPNLPLHIHIMSRNVRQKYPHTPVKAAKRRGSDTTTSSLNLSDDSDDDHGYSGVEDVSDSDDEDEEHVFAAEEKHIINATRKRAVETPRPPEPEDDDADEEAEEEEDDDDDEPVQEEAADDNGSWDGILSEHESSATEQLSNYILEQEMASVERHVRFTGVPDSDSDSTTSETSEDHEGFFPDIFIDQNALDPAFRREIENDEDSSHSGSFWDFHNSQDMMPASDDELAEDSDSTPIATPLPTGMVTITPTPTPTPTPPPEVQELDGYESEFDVRLSYCPGVLTM